MLQVQAPRAGGNVPGEQVFLREGGDFARTPITVCVREREYLQHPHVCYCVCVCVCVFVVLCVMKICNMLVFI